MNPAAPGAVAARRPPVDIFSLGMTLFLMLAVSPRRPAVFPAHMPFACLGIRIRPSR